jgi:hypothetical protein
VIELSDMYLWDPALLLSTPCIGGGAPKQLLPPAGRASRSRQPTWRSKLVSSSPLSRPSDPSRSITRVVMSAILGDLKCEGGGG